MLGRIKARLAGAQHVVTKPLLRQQIIALVSSHLPKDGMPEDGRPTDVASQWGVHIRYVNSGRGKSGAFAGCASDSSPGSG